MKNKSLIKTLVVVFLSLMYILIGYNITTSHLTFSFAEGDSLVYKAKVTTINDVQIDEIDLGADIIKNTTVYFEAKVLNKDKKNEIVNVSQSLSEFFVIQPDEVSVGDKILISFDINQMTGEYMDNQFIMLEYSRTDAMVWVMLLFVGLLIIFGQSKGVLTLLSLFYTCASIFCVLIPGILAGYNIYFLTIMTCIFIVIMTLCIVNGVNYKSLSAGIGCVGGIIFSGAFTLILNNTLKITGLIDDQSVLLHLLNDEKRIDLKAIIFAAIVIGAVGAIMDVAISIASSLNEISEQNPEISMHKLLKSGLTIGRDIMGTMTNTLILAYIGGTLSMVLLLISNTSSLVYMTNTEMIAVEIMQALIGSLGILLTLPLTSIISAYMLTKHRKESDYGQNS